MAIEIVDLPIKMVIFHSYVNLPEGSWSLSIVQDPVRLRVPRPDFFFVVVFPPQCAGLQLWSPASCKDGGEAQGEACLMLWIMIPAINIGDGSYWLYSFSYIYIWIINLGK